MPSRATEPGLPAQTDLPVDAGQGHDLQIAALRKGGLHEHDPVRFAYIAALARRAAAHTGELRRMLDHKLDQAITAYAAQCETAAHQADPSTSRSEDHRGPLAELVQLMERNSSAPQAVGSNPAAAASGSAQWTELKALRHSRNTWTRLSTDQQLRLSLQKAPDNPGPLNSQLLLLRSLQAMQDISPAYLSRYISHVEALLWLDEANCGSAAAAVQVLRKEGDRKRKPGRGSSA